MSELKIAIGLFGLENFSGGDPKCYFEVAKLADAKGIDYITITDHVVMGERTVRSMNWLSKRRIRCLKSWIW